MKSSCYDSLVFWLTSRISNCPVLDSDHGLQTTCLLPLEIAYAWWTVVRSIVLVP